MISFCEIGFTDNNLPLIKYCFIIADDLSFNVWSKDASLDIQNLIHIVNESEISHLTKRDISPH